MGVGGVHLPIPLGASPPSNRGACCQGFFSPGAVRMCDPGEESAPSRVIGFLPQQMRFFIFCCACRWCCLLASALHVHGCPGWYPGCWHSCPRPIQPALVTCRPAPIDGTSSSDSVTRPLCGALIPLRQTSCVLGYGFSRGDTQVSECLATGIGQVSLPDSLVIHPLTSLKRDKGWTSPHNRPRIGSMMS